MVPLEPFKNKVFKLKKQGPGKRSLPGRPYQAQDYHFSTRPWQEELARKTKECALKDMPRRVVRPGRARGATSFGARQGQGPGKVLAGGSSHCVPALQLIWPRVALGALPGARGGRLCSLGYTVASRDDEATFVANGGALTDTFYTI